MSQMEYVRLGSSGLKVSRIILGCMSYGSGFSWMIEDEQEAIKQMKHAYDRGINTFDTANVYSSGESEILLGRMLKQHKIPRENVVIMTKTFFPHVFASVKESLQRLQLDYIDVLQCHRFDKDTPIEETMQALHDVVKAGYVRYIGMSSCFAWQFQLMQQYALNNGLTPFISMQNQYNALYREEEREMMPTLEHFGVGCIPWGPLSGGKESDDQIVNIVGKIAEAREIPMVQVSLAWVLSKKFVTAPIVGVRSTDRLDEVVASVQVKLSDEEIEAIDGAYKTQAVKGHSGLQDGVNLD
ncbi:oxidoreductase with NAD+ or NADP+ as acceptor [Saitozyma sp. JCM 24511]|nr:oxidoreductase with NAD+ or NADP+ as acceptor [Saitozyma sp. JCM 24511]